MGAEHDVCISAKFKMMSISRRSSAPVSDPVLEPLVGGEAVPGLVQDLAAARATAHITSGAGAGSEPTVTPPLYLNPMVEQCLDSTCLLMSSLFTEVRPQM